MPNRDSKRESAYLVHVNGVVVGFVTKYRNTKSEKHPWKAFGLVPTGAPITTCNPYYGAFYGVDGYKDAAVNAVVNASK